MPDILVKKFRKLSFFNPTSELGRKYNKENFGCEIHFTKNEFAKELIEDIRKDGLTVELKER